MGVAATADWTYMSARGTLTQVRYAQLAGPTPAPQAAHAS